MLIEALSIIPVIAGLNAEIWSNRAFSGEPDQMSFPLFNSTTLIAQDISDDVHMRCLSAKDYSGCIQSNQPKPAESMKLKDGEYQNSEGEKCLSNGFCIAKPGLDQLGLPKHVGWRYKSIRNKNEVHYYFPELFRVPHRGQSDRYIAQKEFWHWYQQPTVGTPGYYRDITPAKTTCTPDYTGGFKWVDGKLKQEKSGGQTCTTTNPVKQFVPGTPATPGGPRKRASTIVIDCKDKTTARYDDNGKVIGKWKKYIGNTSILCKNRSDFNVLNLSL